MVSWVQTRAYRFGRFEANVLSRELRTRGRTVRLQDQPFQLLIMLLDRPGEVVTRNEIRRALWPADLHVDFHHSMNNAVNRLRAALGDPAHESRFIENVPRRGYRFVAAVKRIVDPGPASQQGFESGDYASAGNGHGLASTRRVDAEAHELYLRGRYCWNRRTPESLTRALEFCQRAIEKDPEYAQAYVGLADSYALLGCWETGSLAPEDAFPRAKAAALRALELDDTLGEAHVPLGMSIGAFDWDFRAAEEHFKKAIELNPAYATARQWYALQLCDLGDFDEAIVQMRKAERLDPLSLAIGTDLAHVYSAAGYREQSMAQIRKVLELDPTFAQAHFELGQAYVKTEMYREAAEEFRRPIEPSLSAKFTSSLAHVHGILGQKRRATNILNKFEARSRKDFLHCANMATICTGLGENGKALAWLGKAFDHRADPMVLNWPTFDSLRPDARFRSMVHRLGLPA